jgi:hypothetical protein
VGRASGRWESGRRSGVVYSGGGCGRGSEQAAVLRADCKIVSDSFGNLRPLLTVMQ